MNQNPHVLVLTYPAQGHINPMLQFTKRLISKGIKSTLAITKHLSKTTTTNSKTVPIETFSDGYDEGGYYQAETPEAYVESFNTVGPKSVTQLIKKLNNTSNPVTAIVYNAFITWGLDLAKKFGVVSVVFFTQAAAVNNIYYHIQKGVVSSPIFESKVSVPGLPELGRSEMPTFATDVGAYPAFSKVFVKQFENIDLVDWVLFDTFYELEDKVLSWMSKNNKKWKLITIGPTLPSIYLDKRIKNDTNYNINIFKPIKSNIATNWLNTKPPNSVIYISFGSVASLSRQQMHELAFGLKQTQFHFLWSVRQSEETKLPDNFISEMSQSRQGLVVNWCSQLEVLAHESVGCFVTHCGFNSVIEALSVGVVMVCMPQWTDQPTNAKFVEEVWGVGVRGVGDEEGVVGRDVVERCVKEVMVSEKGVKMKENALKWRDLAREAVDEGGSSDKNIDRLVVGLSVV